MKRLIISFSVIVLIVSMGGMVSANDIASSTMRFQGTLTDMGGGVYSGVLPMIVGGGYDIYAANGETAWFGNDPGGGPVWTSQFIISNDAWPTWTPDTPDWYQYSLNLYIDGGQTKWAVRNHPGASEAHPWYDINFPKPAMGVPMSGTMFWTTMYAAETDVGAYLPGTGIAEIPGGAATKGGGAKAWDMDWSWGSEMVPLEYTGFDVSVENLGSGNYRVTMTPAPVPSLSCIGFEPPMDKVVSVKKKNCVLPLKMILLDENNIEVTYLRSPPVVEIDYTGGDPTDPPGEDFLSAGKGDEGNEFVYSGDKWQFNLQSKNFSGSGTYTIYVVSGDPNEYDINPSCTATFVIE